MAKKPVTLDAKPAKTTPETAPTIQEIDVLDSPVMEVTKFVTRKRSVAWRMIWGGLVALLSLLAGIAIWEAFLYLTSNNTVLGYIFLGVLALIGLGAFLLAVREIFALLRMRRMDRIATAIASNPEPTLEEARRNISRVIRLTQGRGEFAWAHQRFDEARDDILDGPTYYALAEQELLAPQDTAALKEIAAAARTVGTATALIPLALVDVVAALFVNMRMIRQVAEIYGGRPGGISSWRLMRKVALHLLATGAMALGDDFIGSLAGGGVLSKLSRRFGEGVINGALTARVGIAAMELCRPMPFATEPRPRVTTLVKDAFAGLVSR